MESSLYLTFNYEANILASSTKYFPSAWFRRNAREAAIGCSNLNSPFAVSSANKNYQVSCPKVTLDFFFRTDFFFQRSAGRQPLSSASFGWSLALRRTCALNHILRPIYLLVAMWFIGLTKATLAPAKIYALCTRTRIPIHSLRRLKQGCISRRHIGQFPWGPTVPLAPSHLEKKPRARLTTGGVLPASYRMGCGLDELLEFLSDPGAACPSDEQSQLAPRDVFLSALHSSSVVNFSEPRNAAAYRGSGSVVDTLGR